MRLCILNHADAPETKMAVLVDDRRGGLFWSYVCDAPLLRAHQGWQLVSSPDRLTDIEDFGVIAETFVQDEMPDRLWLKLLHRGPSVARYWDGKPRRWQGRDGVAWMVRPYVERELKQYMEGRK